MSRQAIYLEVELYSVREVDPRQPLDGSRLMYQSAMFDVYVKTNPNSFIRPHVIDHAAAVAVQANGGSARTLRNVTKTHRPRRITDKQLLAAREQTRSLFADIE